MGYRERFVETCRRDGWDAGLALLRSIFHDPAIQKAKGSPTDFLSDKDDDKVTAGGGFDQLVEGFKPRETIAERIAFIVERLTEDREAHEASHPFQPFDALVFKLGDYERCDVVVDSVHLDGETGAWVRQFGLNHEIINDGDSHEEYDFTYDLQQHPDQYRFQLDGEAISGALLHHDVKFVLFARWLAQLATKLTEDEAFAAFPKVLPFRFVMVGNEGHPRMGGTRPPMRLDLVSPITPASLATHPRREAWLDAAVLRGDTGVDARFLYLAPSIRDLDSGDRPELIALVKEHAHLRAVIVQLAEEAFAPPPEPVADDDDDTSDASDDAGETADDTADLATKTRRLTSRAGVVTFARMLRAIDDPSAHAYEDRVLRRPFPSAWPEDRDEAYHEVDQAMSLPFALWQTTPESARAEHAAAWHAALAAMRAAAETEPLVALALLEREAAPRIDADGCAQDTEAEEDHDDGAGDGDTAEDDVEALGLGLGDDDDDDAASAPTSTDGPWPGAWLADELEQLPRFVRALAEAPPPGYVDAVLGTVRRMGPEMGSFGGIWDMLYLRLLALGPRAADGLPDVLAWATRWCARTPGVYFNDQLPVYFGKMLMAMGLPDVPDFVHAAHADNEYMVQDFYPRWSTEVPKRRLERFVELFRAEPGRFDDPATWEDCIYDSDPGRAMLVHAIVGTKKVPAQVDRDAALARLCVAIARPGPALTKVAYQLADHFAGEAWPLALAILQALPAVDDAHQPTLRHARVVDGILALDAGAADAGDRVARLRSQYPDDAFVMMLDARHALATDGPLEAARRTHAALRILSAADVVYRKAVFQYGNTPMGAWDQLEPAVTYAYLRITLDRFHDDSYREGVFTGSGSDLDDDPFYEAFYNVISQRSPTQLADELANWRAELVFAGESRNMPDEVLRQHVDLMRWQISWGIVQRLAAAPGPKLEPWRLATILDVWGAFAADENHRRSLAKLIWPVEPWRATFVLDERVRPHLGWFCADYRGITAIDLARAVFALQMAAGRPELVIETSRQLDDGVVVGTFLSVMGAYQAMRDYDGAIDVLTRIGAATSVKKPDYVLIHGNLAAMQMMAGRPAESEATLDALFALDWSRFDYKPDKDDTFKKILGGDLDAGYARAFRIYFAMAKYNAACLYAQTRRPERAVAVLREVVKLNPDGYPAQKLLAESDFVPLHSDAGWKTLIGGLR